MSLGSNLRSPHWCAMFVFGHRDTIDQPADLVAPANMQLIVGEVCAGNKICDIGKAVGTIGAWSPRDVLAAYQGRWSSGIRSCEFRDGRDSRRLANTGEREHEMDDGRGIARDSESFLRVVKTGGGNHKAIIANGHRRKKQTHL